MRAHQKFDFGIAVVTVVVVARAQNVQIYALACILVAYTGSQFSHIHSVVLCMHCAWVSLIPFCPLYIFGSAILFFSLSFVVFFVMHKFDKILFFSLYIFLISIGNAFFICVHTHRGELIQASASSSSSSSASASASRRKEFR